jgi:hypothetical protein
MTHDGRILGNITKYSGLHAVQDASCKAGDGLASSSLAKLELADPAQF